MPVLSLKQALLAILVGAVAGNLLLGLAGLIGADARVPGMVLLRAPLGRRGSYAPTVLNVAQNLGWSTFELIIISTAAAALSQRVFGFEARWLWALVFGAISLGLGLLGPIGFVRRYLRKFAVWAVAASIAYLTWWALDKANVHHLWRPPARAASRSARHRPRDREHHLLDAARGRLHALLPRPAQRVPGRRDRLLRADALVLRARRRCSCSRATSEDAVAVPAAVAAGGALAVVALLALTVDESDEAFADIYSTAVSIQNLLPRASQRLLIVLVAATATGGAIAIDLGNYLTFLYLLGSVFVPLFGVLLADWLVRGAHYSRAGHLRRPRLCASSMLAAWVAASRSTSGSPRRAVLVDRALGRAPAAPGMRADGLAAELRRRLSCLTLLRGPVDSRACGRSQSSGTSRATSLTAGRRASAERPFTPPARCGCSARPALVAAKCADGDRARCCRRSSGSGCRCSGAAAPRRPRSRSATRATGAR